MSKLILGTNCVSFDEPCFGIHEFNMQAPGSRGWRRYQIIRVVRGDQIMEMRRDLGPAKKFKADQFVIPGGVRDGTTGHIEIVHKVGELIDIADKLRSQGPRLPDRKPTDLVKLYYEQPDRRQLQRKRRSMVGPIARIQRS